MKLENTPMPGRDPTRTAEDQIERELMGGILESAMDRVRERMPGFLAFGLVVWSRQSGQIVGGATAGGDPAVRPSEVAIALYTVAASAAREQGHRTTGGKLGRA